MANFSQKDTTMFLVGKDLTITATASCTMSALGDGEVRCFTPGGTCYTEAAADANDPFFIALGRGTTLGPLKTVTLKKDDVKRISKKDYAAGSVQLDYIGSNGTSGSIEVANNTTYRVAIDMKEGPETLVGGGLIKDMTYKSDASATQAEIALGLAKSGAANFSREPERAIQFDALCDNAGAAITGTGTITANYGSNVILAGTDVDAILVVGDFLRIGSTAVTGSLYKIISFNTTAQTAILDRPYQGTSIAAQAEGSSEYVTAALGAAANWGVALTGQTLKFVVGKINNKVARWVLSLDSASFGITTLVHSTTASLGYGTYNQVAEMEYFFNGNNGEFYKNGINTFPMTAMAVSGSTYDIISIELEQGRTDSIGYVNSPSIIMIAVPATTGGDEWYANASTDDVTDVLEQLLDGISAYTTANSFDGTPLTTADLTCG